MQILLLPGRGEAVSRYSILGIEDQESDTVTFVWQGGEPTLLGVEYFRKAVALQKEYAGGKRISEQPWCRLPAPVAR